MHASSDKTLTGWPLTPTMGQGATGPLGTDWKRRCNDPGRRTESKNMTIELIPVRIPPEENWDAESDNDYVEDLLGEDWSFEELLLRCFGGLRDLSAALRHGLAFFGQDVGHRTDLTVPELIDTVERHIRAVAPSEAYLERFIEHLAVCRFVNEEFNRVIGLYAANQDLHWLAPLADLGDWLVSARSWFEEGMICEHASFKKGSATYFESCWVNDGVNSRASSHVE